MSAEQIVLHGTWLPAAGGKAGSFLVWGEVAGGLDAPARRPRGRPPRQVHTDGHSFANPHPFAAPADRVKAAIAGFLDGSHPDRLPRCDATILLPTLGGRPRASTALLDGADTGEDGAGAALITSWRVEGVALDGANAAHWLAGGAPGSGVIVADDLEYWSAGARFALELLASQRFLPTLIPGENGDVAAQRAGDGAAYRAAWQPFLGDPADSERLTLLAGAMPPVCRSIVVKDGVTAAHAVVVDFLRCAVDGLARAWIGEAAAAPEAAQKPVLSPGGSQPAARWVAALTAAQPRVEGETAGFEPFVAAIDEWAAQLRAGGAAGLRSVAGAFRTCFRLEPPENEPPDTRRDGGAAAPDWHLRYFLQAIDEPSLLVPADEVWKARGPALNYLNRRFDQPQERLLADLGRAARVCPAIEESLKRARPERAAMPVDGAYRFLRETALLLEESGFGVLLPAWWSRGGADGPRLGVRARLKTPAETASGAAAGTLSLDHLVQFDWELAVGDRSISRQEFERLAALKVPLVRVRGQWVELRPEEIRAAARLWDEKAKRSSRAGTMSLGDALRLGLGQDDAIAGLPVSAVEAEGWIDALLRRLRGGEAFAELPAPAGFNGQLRPYQARGYSWLAFLRRWGLGACLADDMGLGKTVQTIALLLADRETGAEPVLLVCPTSVVGNWQREFQRFAPSLRVLVYHGAGRRRGKSFAVQARAHDVVLSTYALVRLDAELLRSVTWAGVILDEAQNVKNPSARQSQAVRELRSGYRIALTGTPVENHPGDLWALMDFLNPGFLGTAADFRRTFAVPIQVNRDPEAIERLKALVQPFLLRRLKTDKSIIADLPDKLEMKVFCPLTKEQATLYQAVVKDMLARIERADEGIERKGLVLATLTKLKQVCNHPAQFLADGSALDGRSGKLVRLTEMLEEALAEGDRTLVFTQFAEMGELLRRHLKLRFGREVFLLHGGTPRLARERMVERFQSEDSGAAIFILSLKAGGTGLNLTRANRVFHFDRWWNPAVEDQATDRAFRIGQKRNVQVHKFVCAGTLEERIDAIIEGKKAVAGSLVGASEAWLANMSTGELHDLLALRREAIS